MGRKHLMSHAIVKGTQLRICNLVNANMDLGRNLMKKPYGPPRMCNQVDNFSYISRDFGT
jgi:hypothetical protein